MGRESRLYFTALACGAVAQEAWGCERVAVVRVPVGEKRAAAPAGPGGNLFLQNINKSSRLTSVEPARAPPPTSDASPGPATGRDTLVSLVSRDKNYIEFGVFAVYPVTANADAERGTEHMCGRHGVDKIYEQHSTVTVNASTRSIGIWVPGRPHAATTRTPGRPRAPSSVPQEPCSMLSSSIMPSSHRHPVHGQCMPDHAVLQSLALTTPAHHHVISHAHTILSRSCIHLIRPPPQAPGPPAPAARP